MFQFPEFASHSLLYSAMDYRTFIRQGSPIRKSPGQSVFNHSPKHIAVIQTSFIASNCLGIPHTPLVAFSSAWSFVYLVLGLVFFLIPLCNLKRSVVGLAGLEPATPSLSGMYSNQLSYSPTNLKMRRKYILRLTWNNIAP